MIVGIAHVALLVREYEEAKAFYCGVLGFQVVEDTPLPSKRWVRLRAPGGNGSELLLSRAVDDAQRAVVGKQAGGRVLFFLHTDDLAADHRALLAKGVEFTEPPRSDPYGKVAVFKDLYGNRIDLIEPAREDGMGRTMRMPPPALLLVPGVLLMAFKIHADSEPGLIPLLLVFSGVACLVARARTRSK